jgi:ATP-dependent 26S proteasome regulatory subunit
MFKKIFIFQILLLLSKSSFAMFGLTKTSPKEAYKVYSNEIVKVDKILDLSDTIITVSNNETLEIKALNGCARLILNENSKILLRKNSRLILKNIVFQGTSVQDNFEFEENTTVIYNNLSIFITEILDNSNPPFTKRAFFQDDQDKEFFEFKRDFLY